MIKVKNEQEFLEKNLIVKHRAGSHAYGTALPSSDRDYRGIFYADPVNILTPFFPVNEVSDSTEEDTKLYELAHFAKLCLQCNPNIVETLWVSNEDVILGSEEYDYLRENRETFLSSKIAFTTTGYATAQIKRMKGHNKWISNPQPLKMPQQKDFVSLVQWFGKTKVLPRDFDLRSMHSGYFLVSYGGYIFGIYRFKNRETYNLEDGALKTQYEVDGRHELGTPECIIKFNKDEWQSAKENWTNYWTWKRNRNVTRSKLEEDFGYDTKHAMHCVRLMRMGLEALRDGKIIVKRDDAEELISIRNGAWTYDEIVGYAEYMDNEIRNVWYKKTDLPKKPNLKKVAEILMEIQKMAWSRGTNN